MRPARPKKTEPISLVVEPDLRDAIEEQAIRHHASVASVVRALIRAQLTAQAAAKSDEREEARV